MVIVAGLLMVALLCAVLGSIGGPDGAWVSARDHDGGAMQAPLQDRGRGSPTPG